MKSIRLSLVVFLTVVAAVNFTRADEPARPRLRVLTYNIHHGEGTDKKLDLPRIAKIITDSKADLVALQEVDSKTKRTNGVEQSAEYARLTGLQGVFGKAMDYGGGAYGDAILSRFPIVAHKTHALPFSQGREPRAAVEVTVRPLGGLPEITFVSTHLDHMRDETDRLAQTKEINRLFVIKDAPVTLIAGDFNARPESAAMKQILERWEDTAATDPQPTIPADAPRSRIDWVLTLKGQGWRVISSKVFDEKVASDHRPVLVELEWVGKK
jgi:endonuclease/exonuclease/phosphatase family metal-dependent hydrolase